MRVPAIPDQVALADAPPSSPEFIIKKPHDESRHRAKPWRSPDASIAPRTTKMSTSGGATKKRAIRTYSKRDTSSSTSASTPERAAKRQKGEPTHKVPPRPAAAGTPPEAKKKRTAHSTIDGYFLAASDASSSTPSVSSGPTSSDSVFSAGNDEPGLPSSLPSSPPARRWTSPRRLRFRPSLIPISGNEDQGHRPSGADDTGKRKRDDATGEAEGGMARRLKSRHGDKQESDDAGERIRGHDVGRSKRHVLLGNDLHPTGPDGVGTTGRDSTDTLHITPCRHDQSAAPSPAENPDPAPGYTMPYSYYLSSADPRPSPPAPTASKKPTRKVQTTLNLSTKLPFKECKLCDTVYNPLHAADVKLHQTMHARKLAASKVKGGETEMGRQGIGKGGGRGRGRMKV